MTLPGRRPPQRPGAAPQPGPDFARCPHRGGNSLHGPPAPQRGPLCVDTWHRTSRFELREWRGLSQPPLARQRNTTQSTAPATVSDGPAQCSSHGDDRLAPTRDTPIPRPASPMASTAIQGFTAPRRSTATTTLPPNHPPHPLGQHPVNSRSRVAPWPRKRPPARLPRRAPAPPPPDATGDGRGRGAATPNTPQSPPAPRR